MAQRATLVTGAQWGDYDNDGLPDLFLARGADGQVVPSFLFHNDGNGILTQAEQTPFTADAGYALGGAWGDYDNDGWLDLLVPGVEGSTNRLYHNQTVTAQNVIR